MKSIEQLRAEYEAANAKHIALQAVAGDLINYEDIFSESQEYREAQDAADAAYAERNAAWALYQEMLAIEANANQEINYYFAK